MARAAKGPFARAVYDANVLFSAIYGYRRGRSTAPVLCFDAVLEGVVELVASPVILDELFGALSRTIPSSLAAEAVDLIGEMARLIRTPGRLRVLKRDPSDDAILECALLARAPRLVTGNLTHFEELARGPDDAIEHEGVRIVRPRDFLVELLERIPEGEPFRRRLRHWSEQ